MQASYKRMETNMEDVNSTYASVVAVKVLGVIGTIFFTLCFVFSLYAKAYWPAAGFAVFIFLSAILLLAYGPIVNTEEEITMLSPIGVYSIRWDEVQRIEYGSSNMAFVGKNKRLTVPHPMIWTGKGKKPMLETIDSFCRKTGITPIRRSLTDFKFSKNARKDA